MKQQPSTTDREKAKQFYEIFKESFCGEVSTRLTDDEKEMKVGVKENIEQIKLFDTENSGLQQQLTYN